MNYKILILLGFLCVIGNLHGQETDLSFSGISPELLLNANAVLRDEQVTVEVGAVDKMTIHTRRVVTVLNKYGENHIGAYQFYDKERKVKKQRAVIYDAAGKEIKKYKQKDFKDQSAVGSGDLFTDSRLKFLDHTAQNYPYTVVYESEVSTGTTVFINSWNPVSGYFLSVQSSSYDFKNPGRIGYRLEEKNTDQFEIQKSATDQSLIYTVKDVPAYKRELLSPDLNNFVPYVRIALNDFSLLGVKGTATNWKEFGKWQHDHLLAGKNKLPAATVLKIEALTKDAKSDIEKAQIIYNFVQENTRYISVQLGIGGWEPMLPEDVDRLGYGDCKALTNYTKALLDSQNITSHYAVVFGGEERKDLDENFASMQGNHVILNIPQADEDVWLECTSQTTPFNYLGDFTDNRNVLLVKPEGGEIVKTKAYSVSENLRETFSKIKIDENGSFVAEVKRSSRGIPYGNIYHIIKETEDNQIRFYKNTWGHLQSLNFENISFTNNRQEGNFSEELNFSGQKITSKAGNRLLLPTNFFVSPTYNVPRITGRKFPFEIERGHTYKDSFEFHVPEGFVVESIPEEETIETMFGTYKVVVKTKEKDGINTIEVFREYILFEGLWDAELYLDFREFMHRINSLNNQKAVLVAKT